jgi:hypothetical protein
VILKFTDGEMDAGEKSLKDLKTDKIRNIVLIDSRFTNMSSASTVKLSKALRSRQVTMPASPGCLWSQASLRYSHELAAAVDHPMALLPQSFVGAIAPAERYLLYGSPAPDPPMPA